MRYSLVNRLFNALFASLLIAAPAVTTVTFAHAQPDEDAEGGEEEGGGDKVPDPDVDMPSDDDEAPTPDPEPSGEGDTEGGGWGVGGTEEEGRFKPRGKTGRLKELEDDQKDDEEDEDFVPPDIGAPGYAYLDTAIGFGDITIVAQDSGATNVTPTASFLIGLGYRIGEMWNLGIRFPISTGASDGPIDPTQQPARNETVSRVKAS